MTTIEFVQGLTAQHVICAYTGKAHTCRCGCAGKYYYTEGDREAAGLRRGYPIGDDEISTRQVNRILNILKKAPEEVEVLDGTDGERIADRVVGNRVYTVYVR